MMDDVLGLNGAVIADKYEILEPVGRGGFAIVYRARHLIWKRPVALKVFRALDVAAADDRQKLMDALVREASLLAELSETTASICQARDLGMLTTPDGHALPYMVLEWLEGQTLSAMLAGEQAAGLPPRSLGAVAALLDPIAEALAVAHVKGIAHRDVKPANVFISMDSQGNTVSVKLLDFGIAKVVQDAQRTGGAFNKTEGLVTAFTPSHGAPEQFSRRFGATGPWTDVFALALVIVECAAGRRVFQTSEVFEMAKLATDPVRRPTPHAFGIAASDATEAVFARALAVQPAERYPTVGAFWVALLETLGRDAPRGVLGAVSAQQRDLFEGIATGVTAPAPPGLSRTSLGPPARVSAVPPAMPPPAPRASGPRVLMALAGVGAVFVAVLLAARTYDRRRDPPESGLTASSPSASPLPAAVASAPTANASAPLAAADKPGACPEGMVLIPGGEFFMGSDDGTDAEKPSHHVVLSPYCIDLYEVTTRRYVACSDAGKCRRAFRTNDWANISERDHEVYDPLCSVNAAEAQADHPIVCVDWDMASTFCSSLRGGRLPTEAEWEFAARGPDGRRYPWGDEAPSAERLNACGAECVTWAKQVKVPMKGMYDGDDGWPNTAAVGSFPRGRSRFGLFDVAGNVWEWVADWQAPYAKAPQHDPAGPAAGTSKVIRGGAWNGSVDAWVRPTFRFMNPPDSRSYGIGMRCAATPAAPGATSP